MDSFSVAVALVSGLLAIIMPVLLVLWYAKKRSLPVKVALAGAGFFVLVQVVHTPLVLFTQSAIFTSLTASHGLAAAIIGISLYLGLMAALFEEVGRYLIFTRLLSVKTLEGAKLFGLGWGGVESVIFMGLLGTVSLFAQEAIYANTNSSAVNASLSGQAVSPEIAQFQLAVFERQKAAFMNRSPFEPLIGVYERLVAIVLHVCASILVMSSVLKKNLRGLYLAIGGHFVLDFVVAAGGYSGVGILALEAAITLMVAGFVWLTAREIGVRAEQLAA